MRAVTAQRYRDFTCAEQAHIPAAASWARAGITPRTRYFAISALMVLVRSSNHRQVAVCRTYCTASPRTRGCASLETGCCDGHGLGDRCEMPAASCSGLVYSETLIPQPRNMNRVSSDLIRSRSFAEYAVVPSIDCTS